MKLKEEEIYLHRSKVYSSFLNIQDYKVKNVIVYLDIVFPMIFSYEKDDNLYLSYVVRCDEYERELNIISTIIPSYSVLSDFVNSKTSLYQIFDKEYDKYFDFFGMRQDLTYSKKVTLGDECDVIPTLQEFHNDNYIVEDLLPEEDFYISRHTINKLNLDEVKTYIEYMEYNEKLEQDRNLISKRINSKVIKNLNKMDFDYFSVIDNIEVVIEFKEGVSYNHIKPSKDKFSSYFKKMLKNKTKLEEFIENEVIL